MMAYPTKAMIEFCKKSYPKGTRVELISMEDPFANMGVGEQGTVVLVDDVGTIHVHWDCGSSLGLIPGIDSFKVVG